MITIITILLVITAIVLSVLGLRKMKKVMAEVENTLTELKKGLETLVEEGADGAICRVCGHRHYSWFEDDEGIICDWCLNGMKCLSLPEEKN